MLDIIEKTDESELLSKQKFMQEMMADFDKADLNGDQNIDFSEYIRLIWKDQQDSDKLTTLKQLRRQFKAYDLNKDGRISRQEFQDVAEKVWLQMKLSE